MQHRRAAGQVVTKATDGAKCQAAGLRIGLFLPTLKRDFNRVQSALWIRALQLVAPLEALGHCVFVNNPFRRYDVAIYHRGMLWRSVQAVRFLRAISARVYWDTCVDYFDEHEAATPAHVSAARKIAEFVDGVCVTTEGIAAQARRFNDNVFVMPDPLNLDHFSHIRQHVDLDQPVFGWSGVAIKAKVLSDHAEFLNDRCILIAEQDPRLPFSYQFTKWDYASFPDVLAQADVAFLPRGTRTSYERNNSSFKALVYAAQGIPVIANRLPSYEELATRFEAIAFLEDHEGPEAALAALRVRSRDPGCVRAAYSRELWAARLSEWISSP